MDESEQLLAQMEVLQREMARMDRRLTAIEGALMEAQRAAATVESMAEQSAEVEALVPIGGGVHVRARLDPKSPVVLPLGAGYATEAPASEVAKALHERVESLAEQFRKASEEAERVTEAAAALNQQIAAGEE
jgi:prefoldin alpha subunit